jgi:hypothetical protein
MRQMMQSPNWLKIPTNCHESIAALIIRMACHPLIFVRIVAALLRPNTYNHCQWLSKLRHVLWRTDSQNFRFSKIRKDSFEICSIDSGQSSVDCPTWEVVDSAELRRSGPHNHFAPSDHYSLLLRSFSPPSIPFFILHFPYSLYSFGGLHFSEWTI